jgi:alpha-L-arabinofuranosidase
VYLKRRGAVSAWIDFDRVGGALYRHQEIRDISERWEKASGEFIAPEDRRQGRMRIGAKGSAVVWIDSASLMPTDNLGGMRRDVVQALRPLRIPILRYPGGCFADEYHWRNGVGPRDRRPETWSDIWKEWDPNDFGTDEYMMLARELGFEPHLTANYASGTVGEAAAWLEYVNGPADSEMGKLRAQNGSDRPYGIRYWGIGR